MVECKIFKYVNGTISSDNFSILLVNSPENSTQQVKVGYEGLQVKVCYVLSYDDIDSLKLPSK